MTKFQFRERLEDTALPEMFANIYRHKVPGLFEISHDGVSKRIYIAEGSVIHAASTRRKDWLGPHLYRAGQLTREQLEETMREGERTGRRYGQLLVEQGLLSPRELYAAIRSQMEAIVWSVFTWKTGEVVFEIGEWNEPQMIKIHLPMQQVIVGGIKKVPEAKALVARLGKKSAVFRPSHCTEDLIRVALDRDEYALLKLVDGRRSLYEVCDEGPFLMAENARLLYAFRVLQLIEPLPDEASGAVKIRYPSSGPPLAGPPPEKKPPPTEETP